MIEFSAVGWSLATFFLIAWLIFMARVTALEKAISTREKAINNMSCRIRQQEQFVEMMHEAGVIRYDSHSHWVDLAKRSRFGDRSTIETQVWGYFEKANEPKS